jgi:leader peptidase (prepilin peptidase)/N-methyltransferase
VTAADIALTAGCGLLGLAVGAVAVDAACRLPRGAPVWSPASAQADGARDDGVPPGEVQTLVRPPKARAAVLTGLVLGVIAAAFGAGPALPAFLYLGAVGALLALIDLDVRRLPNALTLPSYPVAIVLLGLAALIDHDMGALSRALLGGLALLAFYALLAFINPGGMGMGDVKLAGVLGLYLGWLGWGVLLAGAFLAFLLGGVIGLGLVLARRANRKSRIPFGPFMLLGALVAIVWGDWLVDAYAGRM